MPNITLQTLTPLHIGSGKEYQGNFEFVYFAKENKIAIIDDEKVFEIIGKANLDEWVNLIDKKGDLYKFIKEQKSDIQLQDVAGKIINVVGKPPSQQQTIKQFIQSATQGAYIPGSSLKGAIRTIILNDLIKEKPQFAQQKRNLGFDSKNGFRYKDGELVKHYLGKDPNHDLLRLLQVSDFQANTEINTICIQSNILNQFNNGWAIKQGQTGFVECIPAKTTLQGKIHIPENLKKQIQEKKYPIKNIEDLSLDKLFKTINEHTRSLVSDELDFWDEEGEPDALGEYVNILSELEEQLQQCPDNECIIRISAGAGWDFMTGAWAKGTDKNNEDILDAKTWLDLKRKLRYKSYNDDVPFPKTRKILTQGKPLGFVKLTIQN
ncbi:MAG: type III-A CRISPR-associated RAMP protein Csm5 [Microscillaceae bacterium]|jgi:CRISPR type III-A-associated RAMP protein Csm5|nr:type III-A CRISPR-associated RAMP protein Csm5 [Microscillaceae bacterium]